MDDGKARLFLSKSRQQSRLVLCFHVFKGICSLISHRKQLATCCWEPMEKEYTLYQLCFPYPPVAFAGCGNRHHSGHCCSEIAFTDQSTRRGCIQPGEPGALRRRIVHRDGQCTLSLVRTQRTKERFYCRVWQVLFCRLLTPQPPPPLHPPTFACLVVLFTWCLLGAADSLHYYFAFHDLANDRYYPLFSLSLSRLHRHTSHTSPASSGSEASRSSL